MSTDLTPTRVVCAAMKMDDGLIVTGVRHYSHEMRSTLRRLYGGGIKLFGVFIRKPYHLRVKEQGFIDIRGNFLNRTEAWKHAMANGQVIFDKKVCVGTLYSEHLY